MSAGNSSGGFVGPQAPNTQTAKLNAFAFVASQLISRVATATVVRVEAVDADAGTVDVLPLVNQVDGAGNATPHETVYGLPFFRLQAGVSAIVIDPVEGDLGVAVFADHDISAVRSTKDQANPGSGRRFSMADGIYFGGTLNDDATQYLRFTQDDATLAAQRLTVTVDEGIEVTAGTGISVEAGESVSASAGGAISLDAGGAVEVTAGGAIDLAAAGELSANATGVATFSSEAVAVVAAPLVLLGMDGGNLYATAPPPAQTLLFAYAASGPTAIFVNPTAAATAALRATLVPGTTIDTGLANLVTLGTITPTEKTNIEAALGLGGVIAGLSLASVGLQAHSDRLSGLLDPTTAAQPSLRGVVAAAGGLDYLCGGLFGSSASLLPGMTTGLGAASTLTAANAYANGIVAAITGGTLPATVIAAVNAFTASLGGFETADTAAYASARASMTTSGNFLSFVSMAKNPIPAVVTLVAEVMPAPTIATLKTVT